MKRILSLLIIAVFWTLGCDSLPGKPDPADRYQRPSEVADFDILYGMNCSGCHGADGRFGPSIPLGDPVYLALANPDYIQRVAAQGTAGTPMPAFAIEDGGTLTDKQIEIIANGLHQRWGKGKASLAGHVPPPLSAPDGGRKPADSNQVMRGRRAYDQFCGRCHGPGGAGAETAGSIVDPAYLGLVSDQGLRTVVIIGRRDLGMPDWRTAGTRPMTSDEISDLVAWMASHRSRSDGVAPRDPSD